MKFKGEFLVAKVELRKGKEKAYILVDLLELTSGNMYKILHKDIEDLKKFSPMSKMEVELELLSSKYGLQLSIINIGDVLGSI
ncbi:hypothetical protein [Clostridium sardiniense]|uniref:hypothetical protein n=1 Tax=Clostridium sardiniense TaxID=29369 RepID=UPI00195BEB37|nr:hypothetical protein [Clostridium sardiniense]MBM7835002.1 hypothetical protein [Clostridium sardiniense]